MVQMKRCSGCLISSQLIWKPRQLKSWPIEMLEVRSQWGNSRFTRNQLGQTCLRHCFVLFNRLLYIYIYQQNVKRRPNDQTAYSIMYVTLSCKIPMFLLIKHIGVGIPLTGKNRLIKNTCNPRVYNIMKYNQRINRLSFMSRYWQVAFYMVSKSNDDRGSTTLTQKINQKHSWGRVSSFCNDAEGSH